MVYRRGEGGVHVLKTDLPCLITMLEGSNQIRFASMDDMFRTARADYPRLWNARRRRRRGPDQRCGLRGSPDGGPQGVRAHTPRQDKAKLIDVAAQRPAADAALIVDTVLAADGKLAEHLRTGRGRVSCSAAPQGDRNA